MADDSDLLTYDEAARMLHVSRSTILRWTRPGKHGAAPILRARKLGPRIVRIDRRDVQAILDAAGIPGEVTPYDKAAARVDASPALAAHRAFIMADWPEGDDHWRWVATATEREILSWVEAGKP